MKKHTIGTFLGFICIISLTFLPATVAQQGRGAGVPAADLPDEFKGKEVQDQFIPASQKKAGVIHQLKGRIIITHRSTDQSYFGKTGDVIYENDELYTLPDSRCRLKLDNDDVITMAPETQFGVDSYSDDRDEGKKSSFFSMLKGKAMFYAMRLLRYKESKVTVKTPTAVAAVRGTKFALHVFRLDEAKTARAGVRVADSGNAVGPYLAAAGSGGGNTGTIGTVGDGSMTFEVDGETVTLGPGEVFNSLTGEVYYDPNVLRILENAIAGTLTPEELAEAEETLAGILLNTGDNVVNLLDVLSQQLGENTQQGGEPLPPLPTGPPTSPDFGYFSTLLFTSSIGALDVFVSKTAQNLTNSPNTAGSIIDGDSVDWDGDAAATNNQQNQDGHFTNVTIAGVPFTPNIDTQAVRTGFGAWTEWGYWTHSATFIGPSSDPHSFVQKSWWVQGEQTPGTAMNNIFANSPGLVTYTDDIIVKGTYADGTELSAGRFGITFNYGNRTVTNFLLEALSAGGGKGAKIENGTGTVNLDGQFHITGGQWQLKNGAWMDANYGEAHGAHFGPHGETVAGSWGAYKDSSNAASGIFRAKNDRIIRENYAP